MRVIIIADYAVAEGGAPQVAIASARGLADLGHSVTYVHGVGSDADAALDGHPNIDRIALEGQDVWSKNIVRAARDGIWNNGHQKQLQAILAGGSRDTVVHVHQWTKFFSPSVFAVVRRSGLPLVVTMHDYFLACPTGLMYRFDTRAACTLEPLSFACLTARCDPRTMVHKGVRVARAFASNRALKGLGFAIVHVSQKAKDTIGHFLPEQADQVVIENPVEIENAGLRTPSGELKLTYCGRLTEEKGADLVAEAARALNLPSLFIGEGPLRDRILQIDPNAEITGWLDKSAVRQRIRDSALAVAAPSRWPETGPLVIAEAMAQGVPVIASTMSGAAARVADGRTGYVVSPEKDAIAAVARTLMDGAQAAAMGKRAYEAYWARPPSLEAHARQLEALYGERLGVTA